MSFSPNMSTANPISVVLEGFVAPLVGAFVAAHKEMDRFEERGKRSTSAVGDGVEQATSKVEKLQVGLGKVGALLASVGAGYGLTKLVTDTLAAGSNMENLSLSVATVVSATNKITDATGKTLAGQEKLNAAMQVSAALMARIQTDALQTTATTEQLVQGFQKVAGPAAAVGFSVEQTEQFAVRAAQAMGALSIPLEQMGQEVRSILQGDITADSQLAKQLGITNDQIKELVKNGKLFEGLMAKFGEFGVAGAAAGRTWAGLSSSLKDVIEAVQRIASAQPLAFLEQQLGSLLDRVVTVKDGVGRINPELVKFGQQAGNVMTMVIEWTLAAGKAFLRFADWVAQNRAWVEWAAGVALVTVGVMKLISVLRGIIIVAALAKIAWDVDLLGAIRRVVAFMWSGVVTAVNGVSAAFTAMGISGNAAFSSMALAAGTFVIALGAVAAAIGSVIWLYGKLKEAQAVDETAAETGAGNESIKRINHLQRESQKRSLFPGEVAELNRLKGDFQKQRQDDRRSQGIIDMPDLSKLNFKLTPNAGAPVADKSGGGSGTSAQDAAKQAALEHSRFLQQMRDNDLQAAERTAKAEMAAMQAQLDAGTISYQQFYDRQAELDTAIHRMKVKGLSDEVAAAEQGTEDQARAAGRLAAELQDFDTQQAANARELEKVRTDANRRLQESIESTTAISIDEAAKQIEDAERRGADLVLIDKLAQKAIDDNIREGAANAKAIEEDLAKRRKALRDQRVKEEKEAADVEAKSLQGFQGAAGAAAQSLGTLAQAFDRVGNKDGAAFATSMQRLAQDAQNLATGPIGILTVSVGRLTEAMANLADKTQGTAQKWTNFFRDLNPIGKFNEMLGDAISSIWGGPSQAEMQAKFAAPEVFKRQFDDLQKQMGAALTLPDEFREGETKRILEEQIKLIEGFIRAGNGTDGERSGLMQYVTLLKGEISKLPATAKVAADKAADELEKARGRVNDLLKDRASASEAWERGATDEAGNRISVERRAQLDIDKIDADHAASKAKRVRQLSDLRRDHLQAQEDDLLKIQGLEDEIYRSRQDEEKRIEEIRNAGIAVLQESVEKIKADKEQQVRDEGSRERAKASAQINAIRDEITERNTQYAARVLQIEEEGKKEAIEHANAVSRIKNQLKEQTAAHLARMAKIDNEINAERTLLNMTNERLSALRQIAEMEARRQNGTATAADKTTLYAQEMAQWASKSAIALMTGQPQPPLPIIPFAQGGLIDRPLIGLMGERGKELAIPPNVTSLLLEAADRRTGGGGAGDLHVHIGTFSGSDQDYRRLEREMDRIRRSQYRNRGNEAN
jgi:hypothetical protein